VCAQLENDVHRPHHYRDRATRSRVLFRRSPNGFPVEVRGLPPDAARVRLVEGLESRSAVLCEEVRLLRASQLGASCTHATTERSECGDNGDDRDGDGDDAFTG
jgi:hypothetical protein